MKIALRYNLALSLILAHLGLVTAGALDVDFQKLSQVGPSLKWLSRLTGADGQYGFFAPGVESQIRARFKVYGRDGLLQTLQLEDGKNSEVDLRIGDIIENFDHESSDQDPLRFQRQLSASLSSAVFSQFHAATTVTIELEQFKQISMSDYRQGVRPNWNLLYTASFLKSEATP